MLLGEKLDLLIKRKKLKVPQVAASIDVAASTIYDIIKKNEANTTTLNKLADQLGVSMTYFFDDSKANSLSSYGDQNMINNLNESDSNTLSYGSSTNKDLAIKYSTCLREKEALQKELLTAKDQNIALLNKYISALEQGKQ